MNLASQSSGFVFSGNITVTTTGTPANGEWIAIDLFIISVWNNSGAGGSPSVVTGVPSGFSMLWNEGLTGPSSSSGSVRYVKQAGPSETGSYAFTGTFGITTWATSVWGGIAGFDSVYGAANGNGGSGVAPSVTVGTAGSWVATYGLINNMPTPTPHDAAQTALMRQAPVGSFEFEVAVDNATSGTGASGTRTFASLPNDWLVINHIMLPVSSPATVDALFMGNPSLLL